MSSARDGPLGLSRLFRTPFSPGLRRLALDFRVEPFQGKFAIAHESARHAPRRRILVLNLDLNLTPLPFDCREAAPGPSRLFGALLATVARKPRFFPPARISC